MIDVLSLVWLTGGLVIGLTHVTAIRRAARACSHRTPMLGMLRLGIVTGGLIAGAVFGQILPVAAGWGIGFSVLSIWLASIRQQPDDQVPARL